MLTVIARHVPRATSASPVERGDHAESSGAGTLLEAAGAMSGRKACLRERRREDGRHRLPQGSSRSRRSASVGVGHASEPDPSRDASSACRSVGHTSDDLVEAEEDVAGVAVEDELRPCSRRSRTLTQVLEAAALVVEDEEGVRVVGRGRGHRQRPVMRTCARG